ncbi:DNA-binding response regulator, OmpR family, contains REC and winged-helix (wHTH) domain [Raineyella antarctica]|uniref:DNA-binding response regulator, OmpR family, contains REC and winged-helix (WHTH) domain n=1 Tax=Raineyella antarctica TaxID=1577474 RepID=A0A1G6GD40_9ACTN|nr:response regulator transcription factor [Raineyella antarctica]SDB79829.1 DNA-binding response regulator, OmpR family, contains REC and winged-helix (wHTH) domain [Raineyella antarctica]
MRVLLVEDDLSLAELVRRGLAAEGFSVDVQHNGNDGLWAATENPYDAVVLDIMLPGLNGYDILKGIRKAEVWAPVIMLTAKDGDLDEVDAFDIGADDYLTKPFSLAVLTARLRALIRRGAPARPAVLTVGDLVLDPGSGQVTRGGTAIHLTAKEFALLEYMMRHAGDVIPKAELVDHVWDSAFEGDMNIVEVYIGYLRRKIDEPFGVRSIETLRGRGYRLATA